MSTLRRRMTALAPLMLSPLLAVAMTGLCAALILAALGLPVADGLTALFVTPIADRWGVSELVLKATPLLLCATGLCICFRAGIWNIGAEGQFVLGALCAGAVALQSASLGAWSLPMAVAAGVLAGMAIAARRALTGTPATRAYRRSFIRLASRCSFLMWRFTAAAAMRLRIDVGFS